MRAAFAVLFDMDGVLLDSERAVLAVWQGLGAELGLAEVGEVFRRCIGTNKARTGEIFRSAYPGLDFARFDGEARRRFRARYGGGRLPLKPGAAEILAALREREVPLALASSTERAVVRQELDEAGLLTFFDALVCGDEVTRSKPDPEIFLRAAAKLDMAPRRCFVVEDSFNGVRAAAAAGMRPLMVPDMVPPDEEMERLAEGIFPDLAAAGRYLTGALDD
ncbi:MAG: HAD family phosphatase [Oscillospiraceae bacterium]|nr:HAD family phosphatase [Oscillospiraceae bacterium]